MDPSLRYEPTDVITSSEIHRLSLVGAIWRNNENHGDSYKSFHGLKEALKKQQNLIGV